MAVETTADYKEFQQEMQNIAGNPRDQASIERVLNFRRLNQYLTPDSIATIIRTGNERAAIKATELSESMFGKDPKVERALDELQLGISKNPDFTRWYVNRLRKP